MVIGTLTHRYLEAIANDGPEAWPTSRILGLRSTMARMISQQGHKATVAAEAATHVISALNTALSSDHGRWILSPHTAAACEIPMSSLVPETPAAFAHHVIDRMFIDDGVRWIIDYKTMNASTVLSEEQLRNKAYDYQSQLTRYASLFATDSMRTKTAIFFPAHGTLVEVPIDSDALENPEIGQED